MVTPESKPLVWKLRFKMSKEQSCPYAQNLILYELEMAGKEQIPVDYFDGDSESLETRPELDRTIP
jgi:hypothetical protein